MQPLSCRPKCGEGSEEIAIELADRAVRTFPLGPGEPQRLPLVVSELQIGVTSQTRDLLQVAWVIRAGGLTAFLGPARVGDRVGEQRPEVFIWFRGELGVATVAEEKGGVQAAHILQANGLLRTAQVIDVEGLQQNPRAVRLVDRPIEPR